MNKLAEDKALAIITRRYKEFCKERSFKDLFFSGDRELIHYAITTKSQAIKALIGTKGPALFDLVYQGPSGIEILREILVPNAREVLASPALSEKLFSLVYKGPSGIEIVREILVPNAREVLASPAFSALLFSLVQPESPGIEIVREILVPNARKVLASPALSEKLFILVYQGPSGIEIVREILVPNAREILASPALSEKLFNLIYQGPSGIELVREILILNAREVLASPTALEGLSQLAYDINGIEIVREFIIRNIDIISASPDHRTKILNLALEEGFIPIINLLIDASIKAGTTHNVDPMSYMKCIMSVDFHSACQIASKLPMDMSKIISFMRADGASHTHVQIVRDVMGIISDYSQQKAGNSTSLSSLDMEILDGSISIAEVTESSGLPINNYQYNSLLLALLAKRYDVASKFPTESFFVTNANGISAMHLLSIALSVQKSLTEGNPLCILMKQIMERDPTIIDRLNLTTGETIADNLIGYESFSSNIIKWTKDPLFHFFKPGNLSLLHNPHKVHIAVGHGDDFWSTGIWAATRLAMSKHPNVVFHLVTLEMLEARGEGFLRLFDGVVNPGAGDSYPKLLPEFSASDCSFSMPIERLYQLIYTIADLHNIPTLAACAGAQHLVLHDHGRLTPLKGYNSGTHEIAFLPGTMAHFMALTPYQQASLLSDGVVPEIVIRGDTAHNYAACKGKIGNNLTLGAVSEDGVPMAYSHSNGLRHATQFHPEHYYGRPGHPHENAWFDNFIDLATMHRNFKHNSAAPSHIEYCLKLQPAIVARVLPKLLPDTFSAAILTAISSYYHDITGLTSIKNIASMFAPDKNLCGSSSYQSVMKNLMSDVFTLNIGISGMMHRSINWLVAEYIGYLSEEDVSEGISVLGSANSGALIETF